VKEQGTGCNFFACALVCVCARAFRFGRRTSHWRASRASSGRLCRHAFSLAFQKFTTVNCASTHSVNVYGSDSAVFGSDVHSLSRRCRGRARPRAGVSGTMTTAEPDGRAQTPACRQLSNSTILRAQFFAASFKMPFPPPPLPTHILHLQFRSAARISIHRDQKILHIKEN
jgi:hypothetical protein